LCSARVSASAEDTGDSRAEVTRRAEEKAHAAGFLPLPEVREEQRRRFEGWLCAACRADVATLSAQ
jgi:hypothetical protein